jgi:hypothetical protein
MNADEIQSATETHGKDQKLNHKGHEGHKGRSIIEPPRRQENQEE